MKCGHCHKEANNLSLCAQCHSVYYCDTVCQKREWHRHKLVCKKENHKPTTPIDTISSHATTKDSDIFAILKKTMNDAATLQDVVTLQDVDTNLKCVASMTRLMRNGITDEQLLHEEMTSCGTTLPPLIKHNDIVVAPSQLHGNGVFATKSLPVNVVVTFYPCDAIQYTQTRQLAIHQHPDGVNLHIDEDDAILRDYKFNLSDKKGIRIIGNPRRHSNTRLLAHLINDGGKDVFNGVAAKKLRNSKLLYALSLEYLKSSVSSRNCDLHPNTNRTTIVAVTTRPVEADEELLTTYGVYYWLEHHYGWEYKEKYPFIHAHLENMPYEMKIRHANAFSGFHT